MGKDIKINTGQTLYDINKDYVLKNYKKLSKEEVQEQLNKSLKKYVKKYGESKYSMLLCSEKSDYTIFQMKESTKKNINQLKTDLYECLYNRGKIYHIEFNNLGAIECWIVSSPLLVEKEKDINKKELVNCYHLFPYDAAIIKVGY